MVANHRARPARPWVPSRPAVSVNSELHFATIHRVFEPIYKKCAPYSVRIPVQPVRLKANPEPVLLVMSHGITQGLPLTIAGYPLPEMKVRIHLPPPVPVVRTHVQYVVAATA